MASTCDLCGTGKFGVLNGALEMTRVALKCPDCKIVFCFKCAGRYVDQGAKMVCCPKCSRPYPDDAPADNSK